MSGKCYFLCQEQNNQLGKGQKFNLIDLFSLPLSSQAFLQFQELQDELLNLKTHDLNDSWTYIWNSSNFSAARVYKQLSGHSQAGQIFKDLWKTACQGKHKIFWLILRDKLSTRNMIKRKWNWEIINVFSVSSRLRELWATFSSNAPSLNSAGR